MKGQNSAILKHLKKGKSITALDAFLNFNCMRLAARINDLRGMGYSIKTQKQKTKSGKVIACYRLAK